MAMAAAVVTAISSVDAEASDCDDVAAKSVDAGDALEACDAVS